MMSRPSSSASLPAFGHGPHDSSYALLSRRNSEFGSRYIQVDDSGVYLSSLVVTVLVSAIATIGILLFTLVVTLSVMLGSCQGQPIAVSADTHMRAVRSCDSFILNEEVNNVQGWVVSEQCKSHVADYMRGGQYYIDFAGAINAASDYLRTVPAQGDGLDVVVMDIDETALSNMPYYAEHNYGAELFNETVWDEWVYQQKGLPLHATLDLFNQLKDANIGVIFLTGRPENQRNVTSANLIAAGYEGWTELSLRLPGENGMTAIDYKSQRRLQYEKKGYRVWSSLGDQWSDLMGPAAGARTFKLPNPMYYIF
ncbi:hypothetical protein MPTK1_2g01450 [Marchantia polymorpha subsp. ruderalis]|uniref:Acid phosphatase n=1 Tax=Marchantia polymorpha TaxID=3197 RepID=A0A2R6X994_MARPO|nr:hypothetical protein MARPO_0028s0005 [Marchantia polymorpha]BBN00716.1 hypothetical protein Mp_2g01450 [Marchantia polymorpha subsp. ruderalis]|eukprot:PTQ42678.1 hypothetical protein MARPO_0028s0005 [Marchantia polymorpha]